jgi:hypothetical protein
MKERAQMRRILGAMSMLILVCVSNAALTATWYVDGAVGSSGDGRTWAAAFRTIKEGIVAASSGDTVIVAEGTYLENIHFNGENIVLRSTAPEDIAVIERTIIDGQHVGPVVTFEGTEDDNCVLTGFTIQNGEADEGAGINGGVPQTQARIQYNMIVDNTAESYGGGVYHCNGIIRHNLISRNRGKVAGGGLAACHGLIQNNAVEDNSADGSGGGLYNCDGLVQDNTITSNVCALRGGGLYMCDGLIRGNGISLNSAERGGGLALCEGAVDNNSISQNQADPGDGGGLWQCDASISGNSISYNSAVLSGGGLYGCDGWIMGNRISLNSSGDTGGGLAFCNTDTVQSNLVCGNSSGTNGGGLYDCDAKILNNTIVGNSAAMGGGLAQCNGAIWNCIIWGNTASSRYPQLAFCSDPSYCCIHDWTGGGTENITDDPLFADADGPDDNPDTFKDNDYRLDVLSPCKNTGDKSVLHPPGLDADGNLRIAHGTPLIHDEPDVDRGAYEFLSYPFRMTAIVKVGSDEIGLGWTSQPNDSYIVWSCDDLVNESWIEEATVATMGITTEWIDTGPFDAVKFYRVQMDFE